MFKPGDKVICVDGKFNQENISGAFQRLPEEGKDIQLGFNDHLTLMGEFF